jgi:hypothetical protein
MHEGLKQWVNENLEQPGIRAYGVRLPDHTGFSRSLVAEYGEPQLEETWHSLSEVVNALLLNRIPATHLRWTYEQGHLYFAVRADGAAIGIFTSPPAEYDAALVDRLLREFMSFREP